MLYTCKINNYDHDVRKSAGVLKRIDFDYQNKSYENAIFDIFHLSSLRCEQRNATSDIPVSLYKCSKKLIDTSLDEMQRLIFERGRFVVQE